MTAYDHPEMGEVFILGMNQHLYLGDKIQNTLLCPNQCRYNNTVVDDIPLHLSSSSSNSIYFPEEDVGLPLRLNGCISYLHMRYPTDDEINNCTWLHLTSTADWDPYAKSMKENEFREERNRMTVLSIHTSRSNTISMDEQRNLQRVVDVYSTHSTKRSSSLRPETLSKCWGISLQVAKATLNATTQLGLRSNLYPLSRRFKTRQPQLRHNHLYGRFGQIYSDTMFSNVASQHNNTMGQIFVNSAGFTYFIPMQGQIRCPQCTT